MSPASRLAQTRSKARGFSLLEVLVALLVLSIGLLGLASLQATTSRFNYGAYLRSQATTLAYDMADRMRANRDEALDGSYDVATFPSPAPVCGAVAGATVAARDLSGWQSGLACSLPAGIGRIVRNGNTVTIGVSWDDSRGEAAAEIFEMTTSL
ncbi:MAG TPA: type IV pilus modification protein PilV [Gammaproteobacteria bacterium]|nr:type IV pilus modification protein PilV [Gammaproteobacteria bacterium]